MLRRTRPSQAPTSTPIAAAKRLRITYAAICLLVCAATITACGNTLQDQPVSSSLLEQLVTVEENPVYWLGATFEKLPITNVQRDPSGALSVQYGDCLTGGQNSCVAPLVMVTSPDNGLHPVGFGPHTTLKFRGVQAMLTQGGTTIEIATASVVIDIYARRASLARAAAQTMVAINQGGLPGAPLPAPVANTGYASRPLEGQLPRTLPPPAP
ncbi:MAG: hypothetical protein ACRDK2_11755 [Solirubrobacteraceae bacterium]